MKKEITIAILIIAVFVAGIYAGADLQKQSTLQRAVSIGETDFYSYENVEFIILGE